MRILQAFDFLSLPHGGGTVDIVYRLSKALAKKGHEVTICTGDYEVDWEYLNSLYGTGVGLKMYHSYLNKHGIHIIPGIRKLNVRDYDIVHLHSYRSIPNITLARKATMHGVPYIVDAHGSTVDLPGRKRVVRLAYDVLFGMDILNHARCLVAETETGVSEYTRLGFCGDKVRIQHPLLDTSEFNNLPVRGMFRSRHNVLNQDEFLVLFLGRLHPAKGIETLMDAVGHLRSNGYNIRLVIAGQKHSTQYQNTLIHRAYTNRILNTLFVGFLDGADKLSALVDADVLVQPSMNEAGARPSLEAIMARTPVIVSKDTGAGREIASFDGGLLFKSGDAGDLAKAIMQVIDNPEKAKVRTEKAREWIVENLSLENGTAGYERLYQEAVK